jgi:hypothetical protein
MDEATQSPRNSCPDAAVLSQGRGESRVKDAALGLLPSPVLTAGLTLCPDRSYSGPTVYIRGENGRDLYDLREI